MRAVLHQDIVALACCLLALPSAQRKCAARRIVAFTARADRYRKCKGRAHPLYGNGTLQSCCQSVPKAQERRLDDPDYGDCLIRALETVLAFRAGLANSG
ncbi:DUF7742 family protein [Neptunicoccus cionae]|uniref:DUF7742 domain-containing protein n=1 Tax=Neptunicoccus cionae TaxID=2035344 RepID=A0A916QZU8_9RHOB|nr:hypothetical protein [Amylibacter cionae]GGA22899.1 hypothetical protein GCM10011498_24590 [Amylibacter cionae]